MKSIIDIRLKELQVRSQTKQFKKGERSSKYFYKLISIRRRVNIIHTLLAINGDQVSEIQPLVECYINFYAQLFAKEDIYSISQKRLLSFLTSKLIDDQVTLIEGDITEVEILAVI